MTLCVYVARRLLQILLDLFLLRCILQIAKSLWSCLLDQSFWLTVTCAVLGPHWIIHNQVLKWIFEATLDTGPKAKCRHGHYNLCAISTDYEPCFGTRRRLLGIFILADFWHARRRVFRVFFSVSQLIFLILVSLLRKHKLQIFLSNLHWQPYNIFKFFVISTVICADLCSLVKRRSTVNLQITNGHWCLLALKCRLLCS